MMDCATLSVPEAAKVLGVGRIAMYRAVCEGRVPALRVGRKPKLRIPKVAVEELLRHPERWESRQGECEQSRRQAPSLR
jgi:excisionase family DNA binding protein